MICKCITRRVARRIVSSVPGVVNGEYAGGGSDGVFD